MSKKRDVNGYISQAALDFVREHKSSDETQAEKPKADWQTVEPNLIIGAVCTATRAGAAILFGMDRSQFLFSVTVYVSGEKVTKYFHPVSQFDELHDYLRSIIETME